VLRSSLCPLLLCAACTASHPAPLPVEQLDSGTSHDAGTPEDSGRQISHDSTPPDSGPYILPDGAAYEPSKLPACTWPSNIIPTVPDGGIAGGFVARAWTYSTGCLPRYRMELGCLVGAGSSCTDPNAYVPGGFGACVKACEPDEYIIGTTRWFGGPYVNGPPPDADVAYPQLPSGCHPPPSSFLDVYSNIATAEPYPTITCCPCQ